MSAEAFEQLSFADAAAVRADAMGRAEDHAAPDWKRAARSAVRWCAANRDSFTTDDVLERLDAVHAPETLSLTALGPVMVGAARDGHIVKRGDLRPSRLARRHRDLTVWTAAPWSPTAPGRPGTVPARPMSTSWTGDRDVP